MKTLLEYINESILNEGGNAVKTSNPIPAWVAPKVYEEIEAAIKKVAPDIKMAPLGSLGKKKDEDFTGDIDIAIEIKTKQELIEFLEKAFPDVEHVNTKNDIESIGYEYDIEGAKGVAQVDFMVVQNFEWSKFRYSSPDFKKGESKYKGAVRNCLASIIVSEIPVKDVENEYFEDGVTLKRKYKYTFNAEGVFRQLVDYCGKNGKPVKNGKKLKEFELLITNDPQNCMQFVFGDKATWDDWKSAEDMWRALHDPKKFKWQDVVPTIEDRFYDEIENSTKLKIDFTDFPKGKQKD